MECAHENKTFFYVNHRATNVTLSFPINRFDGLHCAECKIQKEVPSRRKKPLAKQKTLFSIAPVSIAQRRREFTIGLKVAMCHKSGHHFAA